MAKNIRINENLRFSHGYNNSYSLKEVGNYIYEQQSKLLISGSRNEVWLVAQWNAGYTGPSNCPSLTLYVERSGSYQRSAPAYVSLYAGISSDTPQLDSLMLSSSMDAGTPKVFRIFSQTSSGVTTYYLVAEFPNYNDYAHIFVTYSKSITLKGERISTTLDYTTWKSGKTEVAATTLGEEKDTGWINLTLKNNFITYSGQNIPQYRKIGRAVYLRGLFKTSANVTSSTRTIATLPFTVTANANYYFPIIINKSDNSRVVEFMQFAKSTGDLVSPSTFLTTDWASLDGIVILLDKKKP